MTTTVKVSAHCADSVEVRVEVINTAAVPMSRNIVEQVTLQNGESAERVVYGDLEIRVREVAKDTA